MEILTEETIIKSPYYFEIIKLRLKYNKKLMNNYDTLIFTFYVISIAQKITPIVIEEWRKYKNRK